ncbi:hypothetical protein PR048_012182 [Dryococelus australis]|uniref:Uncharacterized protein n=1 Tax=Dryococelus australis TaxID=614101 RepID=A0ABQ9HNM9_9NEOP|nr:hypothetical protein PR048_012182 [Dryococelus australis]
MHPLTTVNYFTINVQFVCDKNYIVTKILAKFDVHYESKRRVNSIWHSCFNETKRHLLENKILQLVIYADTMHQILLDDEHLVKGKGALFEVAENECKEDDVGLAISTATSFENYDFDKYLDPQEQAKCSRTEKDSSKPTEHTLGPFWIRFSLTLKELEKLDC